MSGFSLNPDQARLVLSLYLHSHTIRVQLQGRAEAGTWSPTLYKPRSWGQDLHS